MHVYCSLLPPSQSPFWSSEKAPITPLPRVSQGIWLILERGQTSKRGGSCNSSWGRGRAGEGDALYGVFSWACLCVFTCGVFFCFFGLVMCVYLWRTGQKSPFVLLLCILNFSPVSPACWFNSTCLCILVQLNLSLHFDSMKIED